MNRRSLLANWPLLMGPMLVLASGCKNGAPKQAFAASEPARTFADLVQIATTPLSNRGLVARALGPREESQATVFAVRCAACGSERFDVRERRSLHEGGDTAPRGINLICHGCQMRTVLFDAGRDGFGGRLGHKASLSGERPVERPLRDGRGRDLTNSAVRYACHYKSEPDAIFDIAEARGVNPADLFDLFELEVSSGGDWRQVWDYSCA